MQVRTYGKNEKITKKELRYAVKYMASLLMSKRLCNNIMIQLYSVEGNLKNNEFLCRGCMCASDERRPPRKFKVYIDSSMGKREQLLSLAHEIAHVKQYATSEVVEMADNKVRWKNQEATDADKLPYYFQPWEIDSHGLEKALYEHYQDHKHQLMKRK